MEPPQISAATTKPVASRHSSAESISKSAVAVTPLSPARRPRKAAKRAGRNSQKLTVERHDILPDARTRKFGLDQRPSGSTEAPAEVCVIRKLADRVGQSGRVIRRHKQRVHVGPCDFTAPGNVGGDDRTSASSR